MDRQMRQRVITLIEKEAMPVPECGCWIWLTFETLTFDGLETTAERLVYEAFNTPLLNGEKIIHKCNLNCCVNPDHLSLDRDTFQH